jgi:uroporphyrinogen-III synthase
MINPEKPLAGLKILNTRAKHQAKTFSKKIKEKGGIPYEIPLINIRRSEPKIPLREILKDISKNDWIIFTSSNGITYFFDHLKQERMEECVLSQVQIAVVGDKTKKTAEKFNLQVKVCPKSFTAEALAKELAQIVNKENKIIVVRGNLARPLLREQLSQHGFSIIDFIAYETEHNVYNKEELYHLIKNKQLDIITFTSSSTVVSFMNFIQHYKLQDELYPIVFVCIGPVTERTLASYGKYSILVPEKYTIDGMVELMCLYVTRKREE